MDATRSPIAALGEALYGPRWQSALARDLGLSLSTVADWARGANKPRAASRAWIITHAKRMAGHRRADRSVIRAALAAFEATEPPRDGRAPKLQPNELEVAAKLWADPSLTSADVAAETGLHRTNLTKLLGPRRAAFKR